MNSITDFLDLEDADISITDIHIEGRKKYLTLEIKLEAHFCPCCGFKMHSRGIKRRKISHPVLQDGFELVLILKQRRWQCTNPDCSYTANDTFRFVSQRRRTTNASDMLIVLAFRNLDDSAASIAKRFKTSDTHVLEIFDRYVKLERLPLTDIISVDEVHTDMQKDCKYALVLQDFHTGDPIDLLRSRKKDVTEPYFASIPLEERKRVRYLLSDMYNPYISFVDKYFPNAVPVVDSFHVVQWVVHAIDMYIRQLEKKYLFFASPFCKKLQSTFAESCDCILHKVADSPLQTNSYSSFLPAGCYLRRIKLSTTSDDAVAAQSLTP